jgi:hypothetical protein
MNGDMMMSTAFIVIIWASFMVSAYYSWYRAKKREEIVNEKIAALNEAILLLNYGAYDEALDLLSEFGFRVKVKS